MVNLTQMIADELAVVELTDYIGGCVTEFDGLLVPETNADYMQDVQEWTDLLNNVLRGVK